MSAMLCHVQSYIEEKINRELVIQPDGTITLLFLGEVRAAGLTVKELRESLDQLYSKYYKLPEITVTPVKVNTQLIDLLNTVDNRAGVAAKDAVESYAARHDRPAGPQQYSRPGAHAG